MSKNYDLPFTAEDLAEIIAILDASAHDELYLQTDRFKLSLTRSGQTGWTQQTQTLDKPNVIKSGDSSTVVADKQTENATTTSRPEDGLSDIPAPMVGTFYRAPKPGAEDFVNVGSKVSKDTVIAIIEVMKLMNSIRADIEGEVVEICVDNGELIERGQTLMRVKPVK